MQERRPTHSYYPGFEVALGSHEGGFEVALGWLCSRNRLAISRLWGAFVLRSICRVYAYYMALRWLWVAVEGQVLVLICHFIFEFPLLDGVSQPEGLCPWRWDGPCGSTTALALTCQSRSGPAGAIGRNFPAVDLFLCGPQAAIDSACTNCGIQIGRAA